MAVVAVVLNIFVAVLSVVFSTGKYSSLDDFFMANALSGAYDGVLNAHLYFVNAAYGYLLMPLYNLLPKIGWYGVFETIAIFVSFSAISYVLLKRLGYKIGLFCVALLLCCISTDFYLHVAFTQCAAALTAAGIILLCEGYSDKRKGLFVFGALLMVWGFVMRREMFLLGMPTLCAAAFFVGWRQRKFYIWALVALLLCFAAVAGLRYFDRSHYVSDGYDTYAAYQGPRSFFGDGAFYDQDEVCDELDERGMSCRDFKMLKSWYFYDKEVFSLDSLNAIRQVVNHNTYGESDRSIPVSLLQTLGGKLQSPTVWCWIILSLILFLFSNKRKWLIPWASVFIICLSYVYLLQRSRVVGHVEAGIWLYANALVIPFLEREEIHAKKWWLNFMQITGLVALVGLFLASVNLAFDLSNQKSETGVEGSSDWETLLEYAHKNPNDVFLLSYGDYKVLATEVGRSFYATPAGSWANVVSTGYWNYNFPPIEHELEKRGVQNMFKDIKNENVYVLADEFISFVPYYERHYHETLTVDTVKTFGSLVLLKYREAEK